MAEVMVGEVEMPDEGGPETDEMDFMGQKVKVYKPTQGLMVVMSSMAKARDAKRQMATMNQVLDALFVEEAGKDALQAHLVDLSKPNALRDCIQFMMDVVEHFSDKNREQRRAEKRAARKPAAVKRAPAKRVARRS